MIKANNEKKNSLNKLINENKSFVQLEERYKELMKKIDGEIEIKNLCVKKLESNGITKEF